MEKSDEMLEKGVKDFPESGSTKMTVSYTSVKVSTDRSRFRARKSTQEHGSEFAIMTP